ncbi:MAG TPA: cytidylate kinase-like family protein [Ktedonobacteraceae bacterium]|nr:cytidylate kinase-like family protein [Ktedonobacteraceae bacterium]
MESSNEVGIDREHMHAVTISREYGSGGGEVAARLAAALNWRLVDHEAVIQVARELSISVTDAEAQDEYAESLGMRLLNGLSLMQPPMSSSMHVIPLTDTQMYHETMRNVIIRALASDPVVLVGRGSQMLLKGRRDTLHVRVVAPLEQRIMYVMQREKLSRDNAQARIHYKDSGRDRYLSMQYRQHPSDPLLYDLVINTAVLGLDDAVALIQVALKQKAQHLRVPTSQLGPGTGLAPYPGYSEDFTMPPDQESTQAK